MLLDAEHNARGRENVSQSQLPSTITRDALPEVGQHVFSGDGGRLNCSFCDRSHAACVCPRRKQRQMTRHRSNQGNVSDASCGQASGKQHDSSLVLATQADISVQKAKSTSIMSERGSDSTKNSGTRPAK